MKDVSLNYFYKYAGKKINFFRLNVNVSVSVTNRLIKFCELGHKPPMILFLV